MKFLTALGGVLAAIVALWLCLDSAQQASATTVAPYDVLWHQLVGALPFHPAWLLAPLVPAAALALSPRPRALR